MFSFKQYLLEGGKATLSQGTVRANKQDILDVLEKLAPILDISAEELQEHLVGSTVLTVSGSQEDSGDIDLILDKNLVDTDDLVKKLTNELNNTPRKIGSSVFSFAVEIGDKKVQLDVMFVSDLDWAKFSYHADPESKYKSGVRNELLHAILKNSLKRGSDLIVKDGDGNVIAKAVKSFHLDHGIKRIFKMADERIDGEGFVKSLSPVHPEKIKEFLADNGDTSEFSEDEELIQDPNIFASMLFDESVTADDLSSTEKIIKLINEKRADKAEVIFKDAIAGMKRRKFDIPEELSQYD